EQVFKDTVATFIWVAVLVGMAIAVNVPVGQTADPTYTSFIPRPEGYFLFLFQTLKLFEGPLEIVVSPVLPTLAILWLFRVPVLVSDRRARVWIGRRTGAIAMVVLGALGWTALTARAVANTPPTTKFDMSMVKTWQKIPADNLAAIGSFRNAGCANCPGTGKS